MTGVRFKLEIPRFLARLLGVAHRHRWVVDDRGVRMRCLVCPETRELTVDELARLAVIDYNRAERAREK